MINDASCCSAVRAIVCMSWGAVAAPHRLAWRRDQVQQCVDGRREWVDWVESRGRAYHGEVAAAEEEGHCGVVLAAAWSRKRVAAD